MYGVGRVFWGACIALLLSVSAFAASARAEGDRVFVNEMLVLSLRYGDSAGMSARAARIAQRLSRLDSASTLEVRDYGRSAEIASEDRVLIVVTKEEAYAQDQAAGDLASTWAANLRKALDLPPFQIGQSSVRVPINGRAAVEMLGREVEGSALEVSDTDVVDASREHGTLTLRGKAAGKAVVTLRGATQSASVEVMVQPYAVAFPQRVEVQVTGDPTTSETVQAVLRGAIATKLLCQPGTELDYDAPSTPDLPIEETQKITVPVKATAPDAFASEGKVIVVVRNVPLAYVKERALWYDNVPEDVRGPENLFDAELDTDEPARLLYHHKNDSSYTLVGCVTAINGSRQAARVIIIPGDSRPDANPVLAGYRAGAEFLRNWVSFSGELVTIPPQSQIAISRRRLFPGQTMSGLCYLRLLGDGPPSITVRSDALVVGAEDNADGETFRSSAPWRLLGAERIAPLGRAYPSKEVFPSPFKTVNVEYRVGGRFAFCQLGAKPISRRDSHKWLDGNFGVTYTINAQVTNPTPNPAEVEVVFQSGAGYTGGLFILDGKLVKTPLLQPGDEATLLRLHLDAGDSRKVQVLTCPLSGGSYPATIAIRPVDSTAYSKINHPR